MKKIILIVFVVCALIPLNVAGAQEITPSIVDTTIPVNPQIKAVVNSWLGENAPVQTPYWAITYVGEDKGIEGIFVSLVAIDIMEPGQEWHITDDGTVLWMGSVDVFPDGSVVLRQNQQQARNIIKLAAPLLGTGGGQNISFPWQSGGTMMYGPAGVHSAGYIGYGGYAMSAVDFVGGDDMGSGVAPNRAYAVASGTVDYVCKDDKSVMVRLNDEVNNNIFIYAHLLDNANLVEDHEFSKGQMIGSLKYGTFEGDCGDADQTAKHYHLHFGFFPASNAFRMENCILSMSTEEWKCGVETVKVSQFLKGGGGISGAGDDTGAGVAQPSFWDYFLSGVVSVWHNMVISALPSHSTIQYTYVVYNTIKLVLRIARVMVYSNVNLGHLWAIIYIGFGIKVLFGLAETVAFILKTWKSLVPILGA